MGTNKEEDGKAMNAVDTRDDEVTIESKDASGKNTPKEWNIIRDEKEAVREGTKLAMREEAKVVEMEAFETGDGKGENERKEDERSGEVVTESDIDQAESKSKDGNVEGMEKEEIDAEGYEMMGKSRENRELKSCENRENRELKSCESQENWELKSSESQDLKSCESSESRESRDSAYRKKMKATAKALVSIITNAAQEIVKLDEQFEGDDSEEEERVEKEKEEEEKEKLRVAVDGKGEK